MSEISSVEMLKVRFVFILFPNMVKNFWRHFEFTMSFCTWLTNYVFVHRSKLIHYDDCSSHDNVLPELLSKLEDLLGIN